MADIRLERESASRGRPASGGAGGRASGGTGSVAPWIETLARVGYAARGVLYIIVGGLAVALAMGSGGETTDSRGALQRIAEQPLGRTALIVVAVGLAGYAIWRLTEAFANPARIGSDTKGLLRRIGFAVSGVIHAALAFAAIRMAMGGSSGSGDGASSGQTDMWTARVMELPAGRWLVGIAGAIVIVYGIQRIVKAWRSDIGKHLRVGEMAQDTSRRIIHVSRFGIAARGVVFVLVGWFFVRAALQFDASEAGGIAEALDALRGQPYGPWLLGIVALGLVAFGIHSLLQAKYRRIDVA